MGLVDLELVALCLSKFSKLVSNLGTEGSRKRNMKKCRAVLWSDPSSLPSLTQELWDHIFSFMLRIHRVKLLHVCKAWHEASQTDPDLWRFLVITCEPFGSDGTSMIQTCRLLHGFGEYSSVRAVLEGALPIPLHQLSKLPNPRFVEKIIFARDWAALPAIQDDSTWLQTMQVPCAFCSLDTAPHSNQPSSRML